MEKFDLSKAVGFFLFMLWEHGLGKTAFGSSIGLFSKVGKSVLNWGYSRVALLIKKGK